MFTIGHDGKSKGGMSAIHTQADANALLSK